MRRQWPRGTHPGRLLAPMFAVALPAATLLAAALLAMAAVGPAVAHYGPDGDGSGGAAGGAAGAGGLVLVAALGLVLLAGVGAYLYRRQQRAAVAGPETGEGSGMESGSGTEGTEPGQ